ncbi:hypothetical protein COOONC_26499, partial [Cooperia oncophora]
LNLSIVPRNVLRYCFIISARSCEPSENLRVALSKFDQVRLLASTLTLKQYGPGLCGLAAFFAVIKWYSKAAKASRSRAIVTKSGRPSSKDRAHVDGAFIKKLWRILKIIVPSHFAPEMFYMLLVAVSLLCRTYADLYMIITATGIEASIISRDKLQFLMKVVQYGMAMPAISVTNAILKARC